MARNELEIQMDDSCGGSRDPPAIRGGFATSICSLFSSSAHHEDCCSLACFGLLLSDKTKYLLTRQKPSWWNRCFINIGVPVVFVAIMVIVARTWASKSARPHYVLNIELFGLMGLVVIVILLCIRARRERMETRYQIMQLMLQQRNDGNGINSENLGYATSEAYLQLHRHDVHLAHLNCCSCYPNDVLQNDTTRTDEHRIGNETGDWCSHVWMSLSCLCCGWCCGTWLQCCGMCAVGQEYRQVITLLPPQPGMDYVTFEPYSSYYPRIEELRVNETKEFRAHAQALSELSMLLIKLFFASLGLLLLLSLSKWNNNFTFLNLFVALATFFQSFLLLWLVHWCWNRFDLSLDAVIKYFGSGFVLCTGLAMAYELLISLVVGVFVNVFAILLAIEQAQLSDGARRNNPASDVNGSAYLPESDDDEYTATQEEFADNHRWLFGVLVFINAFVVAAMVEELAKYFSYYMVQHPDFLDIGQSEAIGVRNNDSDVVIEGGEAENYGTFLRSSCSGGVNETSLVAASRPGTRDTDNHAGRSLESLGAGVTVAMVATALGFACCENLLYVFVYTPPTVSKEISTLIARSLFPIHPLAAALQSLGVVRRDLEKDKTVGVGLVILPAWLLHGSFDFVLMILPIVFGQEDKTSAPDSQDAQWSQMEMVAMIFSAAIMFTGLLYYFVMARAQSKRLAELDRTFSQ